MPDLPTIAAVAGGRKYPWSDEDTDLFEHLVRFLGITEIWHGGAIGVDSQIDLHARRLGLGVRTFLAEPVLFGDDPPRALLARTAAMIDDLDHKIHVEGHRGCVLVWPGNEGTDFACGHARRKRLHVIDLRMRGRP